MPFNGIPEHELTPLGSLKAVYERDIEDEQGRFNFAVGPNAFQAVCEGYACGNCLAYAEFRGMWSPQCPVCGHPTGAGGGNLTGEWWLDTPSVKV